MAARKTKQAEAEVEVVTPEEAEAPLEVETVTEPYQALYRRFRPRRFADVFGQETTTSALSRSVSENKTTHAYLFSGPRGCGKTTSARILAAALNCTGKLLDAEGEVIPGEPCGECNNCIGTLAGDPSFGVIEYDAASNRSIDGIRSIIEQAYTASAMSKYKVFIIDEVHALTKDAITAFLKTLEEPPSSVVFILCTTDPDKVLPTVRSRTTSFRFNLVAPDTMTELVQSVAEQAGIELTNKQLRVIVSQGKGSPRDTLSAMERVALGTEEDVIEYGLDISEAIIEASVSKVIIKIAEAASNGIDPYSLGTEVLSYWRDSIIALQAPDLLEVTDDMYDDLVRVGKGMKLQRLFRSTLMLAETVGKMGYSGDPRLALETTLLQIILPDAETQSSFAVSEQLEDILDQLKDLRDQIGNGIPTRSADDSTGDLWNGGQTSSTNDGWPEVKDKPNTDSQTENSDNDDEEEPEPESKPVRRSKAKAEKKGPEPEEEEDTSTNNDDDSDINADSSDEDVLAWLLDHPDLNKRDKLALRDVKVDRDTTDKKLILAGSKNISDALFDKLEDLVGTQTGRKFNYYDD